MTATRSHDPTRLPDRALVSDPAPVPEPTRSRTAVAPQVTPERPHRILTPISMIGLTVGWSSVLAVTAGHATLSTHLPTAALTAVLAAIVAVIILCAFGVVAQAERLADRLGDPYGTLVLTLSVVIVEVILISAVMFAPGGDRSAARDSVMAVSMIILDLVIGAAMVIAALVARRRHRDAQQANRRGVATYLSLIAVLATMGLALPRVIGAHGTLSTPAAVAVAVVTIGLYTAFLVHQLGSGRSDFQEVDHAAPRRRGSVYPSRADGSVRSVLLGHRREIALRAVVLMLLILPIVALSHTMATLLHDALDRVGAPVALSGVLIAMIVFLPEAITTLRSSAAGQMQRVSNLCHGALLSTLGLTIPAVLAVGLITDQTVVLGESTVNLAFLAATVLISAITFSRAQVTAWAGFAHLVVFTAYAVTLFT
ncbi:calcium:proton antiporter [Gordonia jinhuaensis]|uniref:Calcium:proton antiporter n=2 Tax=Gordonia jinhuaensis TaxID=1517702 RepID=A0A916TG49_9ACTN|nr:calcium:proton antiporter [Gordonia jinhuaensis]